MLILGAFLGGVGLAIWLFWESRKRNVSVHVHDPDSHDSPYPEHDSQESIDSGWVHVQTPEGIKSRPASWIAQFGWENESLDIVVFDEDGRRRLKTWRESGIALDEPNEDEEIWEEPPIAAMVRGRHYTEWVETVKQLKRDGQYEKALLLLLECQAATSRHEPGRPAPWYFEQ